MMMKKQRSPTKNDTDVSVTSASEYKAPSTFYKADVFNKNERSGRL